MQEDDRRSAPVCVLGESAKVNLLGYDPAVGKYVKDQRYLAAGDRSAVAAGHGATPMSKAWKWSIATIW